MNKILLSLFCSLLSCAAFAEQAPSQMNYLWGGNTQAAVVQTTQVDHSAQQVKQLQAENAKLTQQLNTLTQQYNKLASEIKQHSDITAKASDQHTRERSAALNDLRIASVLVILGIILVVWLLWAQRSRARKQEPAPVAMPSSTEVIDEQDDIETIENENSADVDEEGEYDFMSSEEGIPAKLDLARAYVDMGSHDEALTTLEEVIKKGNYEQRAEAMQLKSAIKNSQ